MSPGRILLVASIAIVATAVVAGLIITGSPGTQRELRMDERRVADLRGLSNSLSRRYRETGRLPDTLGALVDGRLLAVLPRDPMTAAAYEFEPTGRTTFRLCAEFARKAMPAGADDFWAHDAGRQCFDFDYASLSRY